MSVTKPSRPRKPRSSNSAKQQVARIPSDKPLHHSPTETSLVPYTPPPTIPAESSERPVRPASTIDPSAQVQPKSQTKTTEDIVQPTRIDLIGPQQCCDTDTPISGTCELSPPLPLTPKARREFFPSDSFEKSAPSSSVTAANHAGPSGLQHRSRNPETVDPKGEAGSTAGNEEGKGVSGAVDKHRWHPGRRPSLFSPSTPPHCLRSSGSCFKQEHGTCPEDCLSPGTGASDYRQRGSSTTTTDA